MPVARPKVRCASAASRLIPNRRAQVATRSDQTPGLRDGPTDAAVVVVVPATVMKTLPVAWHDEVDDVAAVDAVKDIADEFPAARDDRYGEDARVRREPDRKHREAVAATRISPFAIFWLGLAAVAMIASIMPAWAWDLWRLVDWLLT